jgi:hypothetical protein
MDTRTWEADQQTVYEHVKKGNGRYARLMYGMKYNEESELDIHRVYRIYYCFEIYENGQNLAAAIEGVLMNKSLRERCFSIDE